MYTTTQCWVTAGRKGSTWPWMGGKIVPCSVFSLKMLSKLLSRRESLKRRRKKSWTINAERYEPVYVGTVAMEEQKDAEMENKKSLRLNWPHWRGKKKLRPEESWLNGLKKVMKTVPHTWNSESGKKKGQIKEVRTRTMLFASFTVLKYIVKMSHQSAFRSLEIQMWRYFTKSFCLREEIWKLEWYFQVRYRSKSETENNDTTLICFLEKLTCFGFNVLVLFRSECIELDCGSKSGHDGNYDNLRFKTQK